MAIFFNYLYWHYSIAPQEILGLLRNYSVGVWNQFLISRHLKTLFSPWHRAQPSDLPEKNTIGIRMMNGIIDFYIRILAAFVRLAIIITGLVYEALLSVGFIILYVLWLVWPILAIVLVLMGIHQFI